MRRWPTPLRLRRWSAASTAVAPAEAGDDVDECDPATFVRSRAGHAHQGRQCLGERVVTGELAPAGLAEAL